MENIHKNLNYANLMKTEWGNQFDSLQKGELKKGLEKGLDVSVYAKPEFNCYQMEKERLKLENDRDLDL